MKTLPHPAQGMEICNCCVFQDGVSAAGALTTHGTGQRRKMHHFYTHDVQCKPWCCRHIHTKCRRLGVYHTSCTCGEEAWICAAVMCSNMGALPLGINYTRHSSKKSHMISTHIVDYVSFGIVKISTQYADVSEHIMLHMIVLKNVG